MLSWRRGCKRRRTSARGSVHAMLVVEEQRGASKRTSVEGQLDRNAHSFVEMRICATRYSWSQAASADRS